MEVCRFKVSGAGLRENQTISESVVKNFLTRAVLEELPPPES
jgi:hypothetical protein